MSKNLYSPKISFRLLWLTIHILSLTGCSLFQSSPKETAQPVLPMLSANKPTSTVTLSPTNTAAPTPTFTPLPSPVPTFALKKLGTTELDIPYCSENGSVEVDLNARKMDVRYPASLGPWPALIYLHGGSWYQGDKSESAGWHFLTGAGFLVVSLNYRLADEQIRFPVMIEDVKCAVRYLRANAAHYHLDPERIAVMGWSAGGHLAALLGTADASAGWDVGGYLDQSSRVQAVVSIAGVSDLNLAMYPELASSVLFAFGVPGGTLSSELTKASPVTYISSDDPPFFIVHGTNDQVVNFNQSETLHARLLDAGVSSTFIEVKNAYHSLRGIDVSISRFDVKMLIYAFLVEQLGGE